MGDLTGSAPCRCIPALIVTSTLREQRIWREVHRQSHEVQCSPCCRSVNQAWWKREGHGLIFFFGSSKECLDRTAACRRSAAWKSRPNALGTFRACSQLETCRVVFATAGLLKASWHMPQPNSEEARLTLWEHRCRPGHDSCLQEVSCLRVKPQGLGHLQSLLPVGDTQGCVCQRHSPPLRLIGAQQAWMRLALQHCTRQVSYRAACKPVHMQQGTCIAHRTL